MKGMNPRQKKLIHLLIQNENYLPVSFYSEKLEKSNRTIYSDLEKIQKLLPEQQLVLEKKPRVGIRLIGPVESKMRFLEVINGTTADALGYQERQWQIAKKLLIDDETVTQQMLAQKFHVSPSSIVSDFEKLTDKYRVRLSASKQGTKVFGSEEELQNSLFRFCEDYLDKHGVGAEQLFHDETEKLLFKLYPHQLVETVFSQIKELKKQSEFWIPEQYVKSLVLRLLIFCFRLNKGKHIEEKDFFFDQIKLIDTYLVANDLLVKIAEKNNFEYQEEDISYVNRQLVGYGVRACVKNKRNYKKYSETIQKILKNMSEIMQVDFQGDLQLIERFSNHFIPMVYRLKMGIVITNPLVEEIKNQYAIIFSTTWYVLANTEEELGIQFNDEEIALIAMYFQISLEKNRHGKKILIVCPSGLGTSELIFNKINRILPAQDTAEITTLDKLYKKKLDNVDLIISSVKLEKIDKPTIKVSTLMTQEDLKNITAIYANLFYSEESEENANLTLPFLQEVIDLEFIYTQKEFATKEQCLNWLIDQLERKNIVSPAFRKEVFEREVIGETALATGVAIPHASPQNVLQTKITIVTLERPIVWDQRKVQYILLMCIAKTDRKLVRGLITDIHKIVQSEKKLTHFFAEKTATEIYETIIRR
ncbi:BglG family transcription antiterminator [Enterococcus pseudoavium]|uniref:BglG family transcription antiterminator n=1 Tax=Enterococcus pseudoavium TaxID=44007 RepID=UPI00082CDD25|nr:PTS sugar transporter subunit IIA [Enterococcus pseudoavium]